jgi:hypothetical protein
MRVAWTLVCAAAVGAALTGSFAADPPSPESTRAALAKWVEAQQLIAKERQDWLQGKQILQSRIDTVNGEIAALTERLAESRKLASEANAKKAGEVRENEELQAAGTQMARWVADLEKGLRTLQPGLPEPLVEKIKPLYDRMPADSQTTAVSLAERYQNVAGILNEVGKFNNEITLVTEVRTLSDGKPAEVRTIYVGLAQAYFVSPKGDAGIGRPGATGWEWTPARDIAPRIAEAVEVLQNKAKPQFVALPVSVQ